MASVVRNVRVPEDLDEKILKIASAETRTISNTIAWLLNGAVESYLSEHPELKQ